MKTKIEKELTDKDKEFEAWHELWKYANSSINEGDVSISYTDFVEEGKKLFDVRLKQYIAPKCNQNS
jgi:hypothetical protein